MEYLHKEYEFRHKDVTIYEYYWHNKEVQKIKHICVRTEETPNPVRGVRSMLLDAVDVDAIRVPVVLSLESAVFCSSRCV